MIRRDAAYCRVEAEVKDLGLRVSKALGCRGASDADLGDIKRRLGRVEAAIAGTIFAKRGIVQRMITFVSFATNLPPREILSRRRAVPQAHARFAIMWGLKALTPYSYPQIARELGGLDHTSVLHGCRRAEELRASDPDFRALTDALLLYFTEDKKEDADPCLPL